MSDTAHQEKHFESYIVSKLAAQGWKVGETAQYDTERALYAEDLIAWLEGSGQGEKWAKLKKDNGDRALDILMDRLTKALETQGESTRSEERRGVKECISRWSRYR